MKKGVTVFDFDKTLTDSDTLFGYYRTVSKSDRLFILKRILLLASGVLYKAGVIKNSTLKRVGISLFLKGRTRIELEIAAKKYVKQIKLNDIYHNHYMKTEGEKWVVSASPEIYLRHLFTGEQVAGTTFTYSGDKVQGLAVNMFGREKRKYLNEKGIGHIGELYTDSQTDKPLMEISEKIYLINQGHIIQSK
jgi:phosphoserine phosphatase